MFLINSRFPLVSAALIPSQQHVLIRVRAPLLPKLRGHFAEFLNHDSLDRLSILYLTTCVGLGYGRLGPRVDAFLGSIGSPDPPPSGGLSGLRHHARRICQPDVLHPWTRSFPLPGPATFLRHTCYYACLPGSGPALPTTRSPPKGQVTDGSGG